MTYTAPTADDLQAAFPAFATVSDGTVNFWLNRAIPEVEADWSDNDRAYGQMLLAAHYMTLNGIGTGSEAQTAALGAKRLKSGAFEIEVGATNSASAFAMTNYGRQFLLLLRRYRGAMVTGTGTVCAGGHYRSSLLGW